MLILFSILFISSTNAYKCSLRTDSKHTESWLCREKINTTSLRIRLHIQWDTIDQHRFSAYIFTLRMLDAVDENHIRLVDRFEKRISNYTKIDFHRKENHTIILHNLSPGRYEICVNFYPKNFTAIFFRSISSCLHVPWDVPEHEKEEFNLFIHVLFIILIIILFITTAFFIYAVHQCWKSRQSSLVIAEESVMMEEENDDRARYFVNQHFVNNVKPLESLVRKRIHQRYAHRSPDLDDR